MSASSWVLASLRREEDEIRARLSVIRARMKECVALATKLAELERLAESDVHQGAYRTDATDIATKLDEARRARDERAMLRIGEARAMTELESVRARLERRGIRHVALPVLENVAIAAPCNVSWASMEGDSDTRFCGQCEKHVYNLSMMSREEAQAAVAIAEQSGGACFRLYRRTDGTVITNDCPVGQRHRFWRRTRGIAMAGLLFAALGAAMYAHFTESVQLPCTNATQGFR